MLIAPKPLGRQPTWRRSDDVKLSECRRSPISGVHLLTLGAATMICWDKTGFWSVVQSLILKVGMCYCGSTSHILFRVRKQLQAQTGCARKTGWIWFTFSVLSFLEGSRPKGTSHLRMFCTTPLMKIAQEFPCPCCYHKQNVQTHAESLSISAGLLSAPSRRQHSSQKKEITILIEDWQCLYLTGLSHGIRSNMWDPETEGDAFGFGEEKICIHLLEDICPPLSRSCSGISCSRQPALPFPDIFSHVTSPYMVLALPGALERAALLPSQRREAAAGLWEQQQPQKNRTIYLCGNLENG